MGLPCLNRSPGAQGCVRRAPLRKPSAQHRTRHVAGVLSNEWTVHRKPRLGSKAVFHWSSLLALSQLLYQEWASYGVFYKYQPIDLVR